MKTVFFDVDTQLDFLTPAGALGVPEAAQLAPGLIRLTRFAASQNVTIVSTADAHSANDPEFQQWKPHCVAGTQSQAKFSGTLLAHAVTLPCDGETAGVSSGLRDAPQIIVEKHDLNPFTNPRLGAVLRMLEAGRYVVYGLVTEYCVAQSAWGLLETGAQVELVADAIKAFVSDEGQAMLDRFVRQGGKLTTVAAVTG